MKLCRSATLQRSHPKMQQKERWASWRSLGRHYGSKRALKQSHWERWLGYRICSLTWSLHSEENKTIIMKERKKVIIKRLTLWIGRTFIFYLCCHLEKKEAEGSQDGGKEGDQRRSRRGGILDGSGLPKKTDSGGNGNGVGQYIAGKVIVLRCKVISDVNASELFLYG